MHEMLVRLCSDDEHVVGQQQQEGGAEEEEGGDVETGGETGRRRRRRLVLPPPCAKPIAPADIQGRQGGRRQAGREGGGGSIAEDGRPLHDGREACMHARGFGEDRSLAHSLNDPLMMIAVPSCLWVVGTMQRWCLRSCMPSTRSSCSPSSTTTPAPAPSARH